MYIHELKKIITKKQNLSQKSQTATVAQLNGERKSRAAAAHLSDAIV